MPATATNTVDRRLDRWLLDVAVPLPYAEIIRSRALDEYRAYKNSASPPTWTREHDVRGRSIDSLYFVLDDIEGSDWHVIGPDVTIVTLHGRAHRQILGTIGVITRVRLSRRTWPSLYWTKRSSASSSLLHGRATCNALPS